MNEWKAAIETGSEERLRELKLFLFREYSRLENERKEVIRLQEKLEKEKEQFHNEMDATVRKISVDQKRIETENRFFESKMEILQSGFRQLDIDRQKLEKDRVRLELEKELFADNIGQMDSDITELLFRGTNNSLTIRKRYKDLMKIFHPDNLCGDAKLVQLINKEYEKKKNEVK